MYKYFYLLLFIIPQRPCYSQWELIYDNPDVALLKDILFTTTEKGYAVGGQNCILTTNNAGATWEVDSSYDGSDFRIIDFIDPDTGLICCYPYSGDGNILITHDGGTSWYVPILDNSVNFADMELVSGGNVIYAGVTGSFGYSFISENYYTNNIWSTIVDPATNIWTITFLNENTGYLTGEFSSDIAYATVYKTVDGGYTWYINENMYGPLYSISFPSDSIGYGLGYESRVWKTIDFGESWTMLPYDFGGYDFNDIDLGISGVYFYNDTVGYILARYYDINETTVLRTTDGGQSWYATVVNDEESTGMSGFFCINADTCYSISGGKIYKTTNGGGVDTTTSITNIPSNDVCFIYPTLANSVITLKNPQNIELLEITTRSILGQEINLLFNENKTADVSNLMNGIYLTDIHTLYGRQTIKWLKF